MRALLNTVSAFALLAHIVECEEVASAAADATTTTTTAAAATATEFEDFSVYALFEESKGRVGIAQGVKAGLASLGTVNVVGVIDVEDRPVMALHYIHDMARLQGKVLETQNFQIPKMNAWVIPVGTDPSTGMKTVVFAMLQPDTFTRSTNKSNAAFNIIMSTASQVIVGVPRQEIPAVSTLLSSLVVQTDHTNRRVHAPLRPDIFSENVSKAILSKGINLEAPQLPRIHVVVTGYGVAYGAATEEKLRHIFTPGALEKKGVAAFVPFESIQVSTLPLLVTPGMEVGSIVPATFERNSNAKYATENFFYRISGYSGGVDRHLSHGRVVSEWIGFVRNSMAPMLRPSRSDAFLSSLRTAAVERALLAFRNEVQGAVLYGWLVSSDGHRVYALPASPEHTAAERDDAQALVSADIKLDRLTTRPPSPEELKKLLSAASKRGKAFVSTFLSGVVPDESAIQQFTKLVHAEEEYLTETNLKNVSRYVRGYAAQVSAVHTEKYRYTLRGRVPYKASVAEEFHAKQIAQAEVDMKTLLGSLWGCEIAVAEFAGIVEALKTALAGEVAVNDKKVESVLADAQESAIQSIETAEFGLPQPESVLTAKLTSAGDAAKLVFQKALLKAFAKDDKGSEKLRPLKDVVWAERVAQAQKSLHAVEEVIAAVSAAARKDNVLKVKKSCEAKAAMLTAGFLAKVVDGKDVISYPSEEGIMFTVAAGEAETLLADFKESQGKFSGYEDLYAAQLQKLTDTLQGLICDEASRSVMERNVDALLASSWGRAAAVELERELKKDPEKFGASLGRNAQEAFERHGQSQWTALSSATRKRMVGAWCVLAQGSRECPGNCYVWSASPAVHFMDVLGLCEPDWVVCSGAARVAAIGDIWKIGGNIKTCTPPEEKPCPTFWDRKGYPYIKILFRIVLAITIPLMLSGMYIANSRLKKSIQQKQEQQVRTKTSKKRNRN